MHGKICFRKFFPNVRVIGKHILLKICTKYHHKLSKKGVDNMSRQTSGILKGAAAGLAVGGATFAAVRFFSDNRRIRRKTAAKAAKMIGSFMDML